MKGKDGGWKYSVLIMADGRQEFVCPKKNGEFGLKEVQGYVGGYVEAVYTDIPGMVLLVNEEGLLHGMRNNRVASIMAGRSIVGDALFCEDRMFP
tara:strand:- start:1717 stop:2001 length:285 start_codon:yes stop_codon:yes gene_type:complete